jgi:hypothetical protein
VKPGDTLDGPVPYVVCATINDLNQFVTIPKFIVDGLVKASGLTPRWPAGVFIIFTDEGATVCVYGADENQNFEFRRNTITLSEDEYQNPPVGDAVWKMWKELRGTPEATLSVNLDKLMAQTTA